MLKKLTKTVVDPFCGRKGLAPMFELMNSLATRGMNIGVSSIEKHGEKRVMESVLNNIKRQNLAGPVVVFDVGANVGHWSEACLEQSQATIQVYAFEPVLETFRKLTSNLEKKYPTLLGDKVTLFNFGMSDENGTSEIYYDEKYSGMASLSKRRLDHFNRTMKFHETIELRRLDEFCEQQEIAKIHFLKIDAEGHELSILKGAESLLSNSCIDYIQFEFGGANIDSRTYFQDFYYLLNPFYRVYRICKNGLHEIKEYKEQYEIFLTTNYLAQSRSILD